MAEEMRWTGQGWVDARLCPVCFQPECPDSTTSEGRLGATPFSSRLELGGREYRGYCEWVVHPQEAIFILHRGYAIVDGEKQAVTFIHNEAYVTQIRVANSDRNYALEDAYQQPAAPEKTTA